MNTLFTKIKTFYSNYKWLLFPLIPILVFIYIIIYIFFAQKSQPTNLQIQHQQNSAKASPSVYPNSVSPGTISPSAPSGYESALEPFSEAPENTITLPDGSVKSEYDSDDDQRPDIRIVHNGVILFQRTYLPDSSVDSYQDLINNPEYTTQGSSFYGQYVTVYADPTKGTAILVATQIGLVLEEYTFTPLSVNQYLQTYGNDISAYQVVPEPTPGP